MVGGKKRDIRFKKILRTLQVFLKTGDQDKTLSKLSKILKVVSKNELVLLKRILLKDLQIGLSNEVINKLYPNLIQYPTRFMMPGDYAPNLSITFPIIAEPEFRRGIRIKMVSVPKGITGAYSQSYKVYSMLFKGPLEILSGVSEKLGKVVEVDTYLVCLDRGIASILNNITSLSRILLREVETRTNLYVFDFIIQGDEKIPLERRKETVTKFVARVRKKTKVSNISVMPYIMALDREELKKANNVISKKAKIKGIIIKDPNSPYSYKQDSFWLRYRNIEVERGRLLQVITGHISPCGGVLVRRSNGRKFLLTNLSSSQREELWKIQKEVKNKKCLLEFVKGDLSTLKLLSFERKE